MRRSCSMMIWLACAAVALLFMGCGGDEIGSPCELNPNVSGYGFVHEGTSQCDSAICLNDFVGMSPGPMCTAVCESDSDCENVADDTPCAGSFVCQEVARDARDCLKLCVCEQVATSFGTIMKMICGS